MVPFSVLNSGFSFKNVGMKEAVAGIYTDEGSAANRNGDGGPDWGVSGERTTGEGEAIE
jgi:hypothetical protein